MTYQGKEVFTSDDFDYAAAKPGDYVEEAVVDAAMNCLPPICMSSACAQMGDPLWYAPGPLQLGHGDPPTPHSSVVWMSPVSGSIVDIVFRARP